MKNVFLALIAIFAISFTSCDKDEKDELKSSFEDEVSTEIIHLRTSTSGYEMNIVEPLEKADDHKFYTKGIIEYVKDGYVIASFDFGDGEKDTKAKKTKDGKKEDIDLTQDAKKSKYEKVVVEPIVKSDDCDYIISGIIEYHEDEVWVATIDFGDGTCDDLATKTTEEGIYEFIVSEYF